MNNKEKLIDFCLKQYGSSQNQFLDQFKANFSEEDIETLREVGLDEPAKRNNLYWKLQVLCEKSLLEHSDVVDDEYLASLIQLEWNGQEQTLPLSVEICRQLIQQLDMKFSNKRKAFEAICRGDIVGSKIFQSNSKMFSELLIRYFICCLPFKHEREVVETVDEVTKWFFKGEQWETSKKHLRSMGFPSSKNTTGRMKAYRRVVGLSGLCFADGLKEIISEGQENKTLSPALEEHIYYLNQKDDAISVSVLNAEEELGDPTFSHDSTAIRQNRLEIMSDPNVQVKVEMGRETKNPAMSHMKEAIEHLVESFHKLEINEIDKVESFDPLVEKEQESKLKIAEEEIERLTQALELERIRAKQAEEKTLVHLLNSIGGSKSKYLLSDLFEESKGITPSNPNVSKGRLINLFSNFNLAIGLEEYSYNREVNELFEVSRTDLVKHFETTAPIQSENNQITVKIVKYGWMLNNIVVIPPLVMEVISEIGEE